MALRFENCNVDWALGDLSDTPGLRPRIAFPFGGTQPPARELSACPFVNSRQGILARHLGWSFAAHVVFLKPSGVLLGPSWSLLGRSWGPLGASWGTLGGLLGRLRGDPNATKITCPKKVNFQTPKRRILLQHGGAL